MSYPMQPLSALGSIQTGSTPLTAEEKYWGGDYPFVTPAELDQSIPITKTPRTLSDDGVSQSRLLREGAVMVCCIGSLGKIGIAGRSLVTNQQINAVEFDPAKVVPKYGFYACQRLKSKLASIAPATTIPIVSKSKFGQLKIPVPSLPEQRRIAAILDQADALRAKRREALEQLDELQQAIFIEMFGDPVTNPKGWPVTNLGSFLLDVTNGLTRRGGEADAGEDIVLRLRDIRAGSIDFSDPNRITLNDKERAKYQVALGELLFIRVNGNPDYVGRCALFDGHAEKIYFNDHVMRVRLKDGLIGGYLSHLLNRPEGKREISKHRKTSAGQHTINQAGLAAILLPIPDETLQRQFVDRLDTLHKWRVVHTNAQAELDALFGSLQHRAFRGEL